MKALSRRQFLIDGTGWVASCAAAAALGPFTACASRAWAQEDVSGTVFKGDGPKQVWKWSREDTATGVWAKKQVPPDLVPTTGAVARRPQCAAPRSTWTASLQPGPHPCLHIDPIEKTALPFAFAANPSDRRRRLQLALPELPNESPRLSLRCSTANSFSDVAASGSRPAAIPSPTPTPSRSRSTIYAGHGTRRAAGLCNVLISNGYINRGPLLDLCRLLDAANINLKAYSDAIYRKLNGGRLAPVLATLKTLHDQGVHLEITNLVVPTYVDDEDLVRRMCAWILKSGRTPPALPAVSPL
jgi:pyruvate formate lyase activating enzyme